MSDQVDAMAYALSSLRNMKVDPAPINRALLGMQPAFEGLAASFRRAARSLQSMTKVVREVTNEEVRVSGLEARMIVLGGMLGTHVGGDVDETVLTLMRDPGAVTGERVDRLLTTRSRARLAAALLRGHASQTRTQAGPVVLRRHWCGRDVSVSKVGGAFVVTT
jgi:hypothetical protein